MNPHCWPVAPNGLYIEKQNMVWPPFSADKTLLLQFGRCNLVIACNQYMKKSVLSTISLVFILSDIVFSVVIYGRYCMVQ